MKISIITTVYKAEQDLPRLLDSMMALKSPELEFFLIDNGSPDRCGEICQEYAAKDPRFTVYTLKENIGYIRARNVGIEACDGDYVGFCDSDDYLEPGGYDRAVQKIKESGCDLLLGSYFQNSRNEEVKIDPPYAPGIYRSPEEREAVLLQAFGNMPDRPILTGFIWKNIYRRSILMNHGIRFLLNLMPYEDEIFNIDVITRCACVCCDHIPLYHYVVNEESITLKMVRNFDPVQAWQRIGDLYREKNIRRTTALQTEAICNEMLQMIYEYILVLCKQGWSARRMTEVFKQCADRQLIRTVVKRCSKKQPKVLMVVRGCLGCNAVWPLLFAIRLGLKRKYR
jgi:glycosyltransferase involved in cell wall biosynthesis